MTEKLKKVNVGAIALTVLVFGVILVLMSGKKEESIEKETKSVFNENNYEEALEKRLKDIIEKIDGVGEVTVMITLEGSALYTYATDTTQDTKADGDSKRESTVVLSVNGTNNKEAVVSGYTLPDIKGAAVVCSRTLTPTLQGKVIGVTSAALGISTSKIFVTN